MGLTVTVSESPDALADALALRLAQPASDPFASEIITVPGDGVRTSLIEHLSRRLGAVDDHDDGIAANLQFMFPGGLIRRALAGAGDQRWEVNRLMWAIHRVLGSDGSTAPDLARCRMIADLFDRYSVHRREMLRAWERGRAVDAFGRALPEHHRWQPQLWRDLVALLGEPSAPTLVESAILDLRAGRLHPDLGERVMLYGLASLPPPHLDVLAALATQIDVHLFVPVWSAVVWDRLIQRADDSVAFPIPRTEDPSSSACGHRLAATWARGPRESHYLLINRLLSSHRTTQPEVLSAEPVEARCALEVIQAHLRSDLNPSAPIEVPDGDDSIRWYRCHGVARQAEVLRDALLHLLQLTTDEGAPRYQPRDIAVLCPDPAMFAPVIEAAFAGDPDHGVPRVPVRLADRSLRSDTPLMAVVGAVLDLIDGRFRASGVLELLSLAPVQQRFGLDDDRAGQIGEWVAETNTSWGLDSASQQRFGLPEAVVAHSWQAGLNQLAVGAALADPDLVPDGFEISFGPGETPPTGSLEGDDLDALGALAGVLEVLDRLRVVIETESMSVMHWAGEVRDLIHRLCALPDDDVWQWNQFHDHLDSFVEEARPTWLSDTGRTMGTGDIDDTGWERFDSNEIARVFAGRLGGSPGRVRFGTGAVTLSSLTAQRGVPHRVICIIGLDGDLGSTIAPADDLTATLACVGDRDARAEFRAQLLDAISVAGERLILASSGFEVRNNREVAPAVPVMEFLDLIDASITDAGHRRGRDLIAIDQPRHGWSASNFVPGALGVPGPWSFDTVALEAATQRDGGADASLIGVDLDAEPIDRLVLSDIEMTLRRPVRTLLASRLGVSVRTDAETVDDAIALEVDALAKTNLRTDLFSRRLSVARARVAEAAVVDAFEVARLSWDEAERYRWRTLLQRSGAVPPLAFGERTLDAAEEQAADLIDQVVRYCPEILLVPAEQVVVDCRIGGRQIDGLVGPVHRVASEISDTALLAMVRGGTFRPEHKLILWLQLAALECTAPQQDWRAVSISHDDKALHVETLRLIDPHEAAAQLEFLIDVHDRALRHVIPAFARTTEAVFTKGLWSGARRWSNHEGYGEGDDDWVRLAIGDLDFADLAEWEPRADEAGPSWGASTSRLERWAHHLWGTFAESVEITEEALADHEGRR
jgi:exodeoxyribonuclease V gamma subunit